MRIILKKVLLIKYLNKYETYFWLPKIAEAIRD